MFGNFENRFPKCAAIGGEIKKLEIFVAMKQNAGKQVITVVGSDSCLLQACMRCTEVETPPSQNFSHYAIIIQLHFTILTLAWI